MTPDLHEKMRLELIIESPALRRAEEILLDAKVTGWTVVPAVSGYNGKRRWSRGTDISASTDMMVLICVGDAEFLLPCLSRLHNLLKRHIGILDLTTVHVLRDTEF